MGGDLGSESDAGHSGQSRLVTFHGRRPVTIEPGQAVVSDPVTMRVPAATDFAVSLFVPRKTGPVTYNSDAQQVNYVSGPGDFAGQTSGAAFTTTSQHWYFLDAVDVLASSRVRGTVVAFGDSITDGYQSNLNANARWPNDLARRFLAGPPGQALGVVDEGISGNRVLNNSACFGIRGVTRFLRDVAARTGGPVRDRDRGHQRHRLQRRDRCTTPPPARPSERRSTTGSAPRTRSTG